MALEHARQLGLVLLFAQRRVRPRQPDRLVTREINRRHHLEGRLEAQRLTVHQLHVDQLRLRYRTQRLPIDRLTEARRDQTLQHLLSDLLGELRPDQRLRHLACAKPRNACQLLVLLHQSPKAVCDLLGRRFDLDLTPQLRVHLGCVLVVVVMLVFGCCGALSVELLRLVALCHLTRCQSHAFRRTAINLPVVVVSAAPHVHRTGPHPGGSNLRRDDAPNRQPLRARARPSPARTAPDAPSTAPTVPAPAPPGPCPLPVATRGSAGRHSSSAAGW